ncbi:MAG TPA: sulfate transporter CysZ [Gammaproteobacteria bacterium]|nr:sulfate transporter CysZ [Gammaproteobacteria bacterium]
MKDSVTGVGCLMEGWRLIRRPGLRRYVAIPLAINAVLFAAAIGLAAVWFDELINHLLHYLPHWLDWLRYLLWPLFAAGALIGVFYTFTLVANIIAAPFNALLSEAVEHLLTGAAPVEGGWLALLKDVLPSLMSEVRKLGYFVLWAIPLAILSFIPVINLAAPFLWALFSAWMLALEYADYPMANHGLQFVAQRERLRRRRLLALGFGGATLVLTLIPIVNFFAMPAAVAGATVMWVRELRGGGADA